MRRRLSSTAILLAAMVMIILTALLGCERATNAPEQELLILAFEYRFEPSELVVPGGTRLRLRLENRGDKPHSFKFSSAGADVRVFVDKDETASGILVVPERPGEYAFWCDVGSHRELGMEGTLTIQDDNQGKP